MTQEFMGLGALGVSGCPVGWGLAQAGHGAGGAGLCPVRLRHCGYS